MADSVVNVNSGSGIPVSVRTNAAGENMQVVMLGVDGSDSVCPSDATFGQGVDVKRSVLPTGAATETALQSILTELQLKADLAETQPVSAVSLPLPTGAATEATLAARLAEATFTGRLGEVQLTPTANTLLGRLKSAEDKLDALLTELQQKTEPGNTQLVDTEFSASSAIGSGYVDPSSPPVGAALLGKQGGNTFTPIGLTGYFADGNNGGVLLANAPWLYNGTTWDYQRANTAATLLASAARTADTNSADQTNQNGDAVHVVIDVTANAAAFSITPYIEAKDIASGKYYTLLQGAAITATGTTVLKVGRGIAALADAAAQDMLPRTWRVRIDHLDATSVTYSVGASVGL